MQQKVFLKGHGTVKPAEEQVEENKTEGMEFVEDKEPEFQQDAVGYGAGAEPNPMADLVEEEEVVATAEGDALEEAVASAEDEEKVVVNRTELPVSSNPGFDETAVQDAQRDMETEGGVTNPRRSTGPMRSNGDASTEGGIIQRPPLADSTPGAYELSGIHVEVSVATGLASVQITQDFKDLDTAKASISGDKYLMPAKEGGFTLCRITRGAPIICFEERQILEYVNNVWRRP